jgi:hypothetical protein
LHKRLLADGSPASYTTDIVILRDTRNWGLNLNKGRKAPIVRGSCIDEGQAGIDTAGRMK